MMRRRWSGLLLVAALTSAGAWAKDRAAQPAAYQIDTGHSSIGFSVRHLGISKVKGDFKDFGGEVWADPETGKLTKVIGVVKTASVDTGSEGRDDHLRTDDFFNSEKYPEMRIETSQITWMGDRFRAHANVTIRDKTLPVVFKGELLGAATVTFGKKQHRAGYSVTGTINRQDFGLRFNRLAEGVSVVGDEVTITLDVEVNRVLE